MTFAFRPLGHALFSPDRPQSLHSCCPTTPITSSTFLPSSCLAPLLFPLPSFLIFLSSHHIPYIIILTETALYNINLNYLLAGSAMWLSTPPDGHLLGVGGSSARHYVVYPHISPSDVWNHEYGFCRAVVRLGEYHLPQRIKNV